ncbi:hypothetical protein [Hyphococcus sp. DH-69]|uniref:hypothetical protein n=1 Tax=Hyphococcus formosus TaxID=3143534 RepID=UPI00398B04F3
MMRTLMVMMVAASTTPAFAHAEPIPHMHPGVALLGLTALAIGAAVFAHRAHGRRKK